MIHNSRPCRSCGRPFTPTRRNGVRCDRCLGLGLSDMSTYRAWLPGELRRRQRGLCAICHEPLPDERDQVEIDHIHPLHRGGTDDIVNLRLVHIACNQARADYDRFPMRPPMARYLKERRREQRRRLKGAPPIHQPGG